MKKVYETRLRRRLDPYQEVKCLPIVSITKLTDVNVDCLEHIFKNLNLVDLLNVADSNKQLKLAADLVFESQFGKHSVSIDLYPRHITFFEMDDRPRMFIAIPWSFRYKVLRCFGHMIKKLDIYYYDSYTSSYKNSKLIARIDHYVNEYCSDSLVELRLKDHDESTMKSLKKPFNKVESICFDGGQLGNNLSNLNKWLPNLRHLKFPFAIRQSNFFFSQIEPRFYNLQDLTLYLPYKMNQNHLNKKILAKFLRLNSNIRSLSISGAIDAKYLQSVSEHLQHLESLEINRSSIQPVKFSNIGNDTIYFREVKKLELISIAPEKIPVTIGKAEEFIFRSIDMNHTVADFISKHTSLTKLAYSGYKHVEKGALLKMASPSLVEVNLGKCAFPVEEVVAFINKCTSLKHFSIRIRRHEDYKAVQDQLGDEWRIIKTDDCLMISVTMKR